MLLSPKLFHCGCIAVLLITFLSCGSAHDSDENYVFVAANLQVPYWQTAGAGFTKAAAPTVDDVLQALRQAT